MVRTKEADLAAADTLEFMRRYSTLVDLQIQAIADEMAHAVLRITGCVEQISALIEAGRAKAEDVLHEVHLAPDADTRLSMAKAQASVDSIFADAMSDQRAGTANSALDSADAATRRRSGSFSKNVEALTQLASTVVKPLVAMMGVLSTEDVVGQRLHRTSLLAKTLMRELGEVGTEVTDWRSAGLAAREGTLKIEAMRHYTTVAGRQVLSAVFPQESPEPGVWEHGNQDELLIFLQFVAKFSDLLKRQLQGVKSDIATALETVMSTVLGISDLAEQQKRHADAIYLKGPDGTAHFVQASLKEHQQSEWAQAGNLPAAGKIPAQAPGPRGGHLALPIQLLESVDGELGAHVVSLMGELSMEDVIGQHLDHTIAALSGAQKFLELIASDPVRLTTASVKDLSASLLRQLYQRYTMESEKACFKSVFGPVPAARVAPARTGT